MIDDDLFHTDSGGVRSPRRMTKVEAIAHHLDKRALQRLGFVLSRETKRRLVADIQAGELPFLWKSSNNRSAFKATIHGHDLVVIYDRKRKQIVTCWPYTEQGGTL